MREILVKIQKPIWGGGKPQIGIADFRVEQADKVNVEIEYTRKDGTKSYPDTYSMLVSKLKTYPTQVVGGGVTLYVAPLKDWETGFDREFPRYQKPTPPIPEPLEPVEPKTKQVSLL